MTSKGRYVHDIFIYNIEENQKIKVTEGRKISPDFIPYAYGVKWSSDSNKILYVSSEDGKSYNIYLYALVERKKVKVFPSDEWDGSPFFSQDDRRMLFVSARDGNAKIFLVECEEKISVENINTCNLKDIEEGFFPILVNENVFFVSQMKDGYMGIFRTNLNLQEKKREKVFIAKGRFISVSPGKNHIAFFCDENYYINKPAEKITSPICISDLKTGKIYMIRETFLVSPEGPHWLNSKTLAEILPSEDLIALIDITKKQMVKLNVGTVKNYCISASSNTVAICAFSFKKSPRSYNDVFYFKINEEELESIFKQKGVKINEK